MKFALIFLAFVGIAFARIEEHDWLNQLSPNRKIEDSAFRPGREYQYFYNGQLATGIAGASKQHSANRIQALVQISMNSESDVILRLQNVRVGKLNRQIPNPRRMMPFDAFEDTPIEQHLKQKLELPMKFSYSNGLVRDVEFDSKEDPWSANVKRGVLNLLQVNLQQHRKIESNEESKLTNARGRNTNENENAQFYRVMEETVEGECETVYSIQSQPDRRASHSVLNVTKSINFEKCNKRPQIKYNFRFAVKNPNNDEQENEQEEEEFLKSSTVVQYNITGDRNQFLIESARTESQYVFAPFNEETNVIVTYVNQTLVLVKTGPISHTQQPQNPIKSDSNMVFTLDWSVAHERFSMQGGSQSNSKFLQNSANGINKVEAVKKILRKVVTQMKEQVDEELPQQFDNLVEWLRQLDHQELEQFVRMQEAGQFSSEEEKKIKNIIPQALGVCATKDCVKHLTQKIRQGQIGPLRGALALKGLLHSRAVSKDMIQEIIQLGESEKARESEILKRTSWLTVGSLMNALCADNEDQLALELKEDSKKLCGREQKETFVKFLFEKLRQAAKWQDKVLILKTIGNAGLDLSIFELEKIVRQQDATYPMYTRLEAVLAMRGLKHDMPKKIQRILMPIALNRREYPTLRSIAAYMLLETQPERPILDQLARNLIDEPSHQFASFVYTQLHSYANSTNPYEKRLSADAKLALRQAKKINTGLGYSRFNHFTFHSENQKVGLDLDIGTVFSNVSAIPRHVGLSMHTSRLGYWQKLLASVSLFNEGLEPLIREFSADRFWFSSSLSNSLTDMLQQQRHPRNVRNGNNAGESNEYERELDEIFNSHLKIRNRQYNDEYENEPKAYFSAMFKSQTVAVLPLGKEILQEVAQQARTQASNAIQKLQRGVQFDYTTAGQLQDLHLRIPTSLGYLLSVSMRAPVAVSLKGRVQASMESSKNVRISAELKPSAVATFVTDVQAWSPIVVSGVKYQMKAKLFTPIDAKVDVELGSNPQVRAQIKPPTQKRDLVVLESRPITYTRVWQEYLKNPESDISKDEQTIAADEINRLKTVNKCGGRQTLGFDVCIRGQVQCTPGQQPTGTPFGPLTGQGKLVITSQATENNRDIEIKINAQRQQLNGNDIHRPSFSFAGRQSPFQDGSESESDSTSEEQDSQQLESQQQRSTERRQGQHQGQHQGQRHQQQPQQQQQRQQQSQQQRNQHNIFQEYRNYQVKSGYKTQVNVEVKTASDKKVSLQLNHIFDLKRRYGKLDAKLQTQHPEQWQACFDAELMLPEQPQFINDVKEKKAVAHAQLRWGQSCDSQNFIQVTTQAQRSSQQMQWERDQGQYKRYNSKQQCQNNKAWCSPLAQEDFVEKIGHMLKYRVDIDYRNVPSTVQNITNKLYRALKHYYYWQTDVDQINVQNQQNQIRAEFVLDAQTKQRVNVTIRMPRESIKIQDMPLSQPIVTLNQKQPFGQQLRNYFDNQQENDDQSECSVTGKTGWQKRSQIETFDGTKYSAPFTNCWVVLSKDCGSQKPEFVVMARKSESAGNANNDLKEVKIITRTHKIHMTPESEEYDSIKVTVNGRPYNPETEADIEDHGHVVAKIDKEGQSIHVDLPETGVDVEFDGYAINVKLSEYYQGQQCGLCGHYDKESADEFRNPDFTQEQDLRQFYMNYLIKDAQCRAPQQLSEICQDEDCDQDRSNSGSSSSSSSSSGNASSSGSGSSSSEDGDDDKTTEKPTHKTKVIEMDDQICFSIVPVPQCDDDSYSMQTKEQKQVQYACLEQNSQSAEEFERRARQGKKIIQGLSNRQPNFTRTENIPEKCKKYKN